MRLTQQSLGAQLLQLQWQGSDLPLFYLSPISMGDLPRRGGVPILFPQFADRGNLAKHGFARNLSWSCIEQTSEANQECQRSHYRLVMSNALLPEWPYAASLDLLIDCQPDALKMHLQICNTGARAFEWSGGLHPYFYVDDLLQVQVKGLQNTAYEDRYPIKPSVPLQEENCMGFDGAPIERLYQGCPPLKLVQARRHLQLSCTGFSQWMIWNPGEAGQAQFSDLPPGDWRHFICIEPVIASHSQKLEPGQCFEGTLSIEVIKG